MIKIYSSLTRKKEQFIPLVEGEVKMYACGVTPYDEIHIGHARQAVVYDVIRAYLEYAGYHVVYVRNFTDVDDKIIKRANKEGKEASEVSAHFIEENSKDLEQLKVRKATFEPKVTECMDEIISFIQGLIDKGFAYVKDGEVFFEIDKFADYGKLSNRKKDELINAEESPNKKSANDFVLWKPCKPGEPFWDSPWSKGRPGWHIECSAMVYKYLGESIDIHGGGLDLIFPHHENEVAQSEAFTGKKFATYWLHNGLVMSEGVKMSKSLGNFITVKDALKIASPEELRYAILAQSYSSEMDFSKDMFSNARKRAYYFYQTLERVRSVVQQAVGSAGSAAEVPPVIADLESKFVGSMDDNFNTAKVLAEVADAFREVNKVIDSKALTLGDKASILESFLGVFGKISSVLRLFEEDPATYLKNIRSKILSERGVSEEYIDAIIKDRSAAKMEKDWATADKLKDELLTKGISLKDSPEAVTWEIVFD